MDEIREFLPDFGMAWRLFWDRRVSLFRKIFYIFLQVIGFISSLVYMWIPIDFIPEAVFGPIGLLDDLAMPVFVFVLITKRFVGGVSRDLRQQIVDQDRQKKWAKEEFEAGRSYRKFGRYFYTERNENGDVVSILTFDNEDWLREVRFPDEGVFEVKDERGRWQRFGGSDE